MGCVKTKTTVDKPLMTPQKPHEGVPLETPEEQAKYSPKAGEPPQEIPEEQARYSPGTFEDPRVEQLIKDLEL